MITLICTKCRATLEMDDGFAGGVCRCKHCGTIQTVPAHLKSAKGAEKKGSKTIYSSAPRGEAVPSSGLDELAHVVASSGLTSGRLRSNTVPARGNNTRQKLFLMVGAGALLAVGVAIGIWISMGGSTRRPQDPPGAIGAPSAAKEHAHVEPVVQSNAFGIPIADRTVVYVLDRGSATAAIFSYVKEAAFHSLQTLGGNRRFQVIFWNNGTDDFYPASAPTFATPANIEAARRALDGVFAHGQTDIESAMRLAVKSDPDVIVIATAKGLQLDDAFASQVLNILGDRKIKVHTIALGGGEAAAALTQMSQRTGGQTRVVDDAELRRLARN